MLKNKYRKEIVKKSKGKNSHHIKGNTNKILNWLLIRINGDQNVDGKESTCNVGDLASIPGLGRSPGGGHGNPLQYLLALLSSLKDIKLYKVIHIKMHSWVCHIHIGLICNSNSVRERNK